MSLPRLREEFPLSPADAPALTAAVTDLEIVATFLRSKSNAHTQRSYGRELWRFLRFCEQRGRSLAEVRLEDLQDYRDLLARDLDESMVSGRIEPRFTAGGAPNPDYRLFAVERLSAASQRAALAALSSFFAFAARVRYLPGDPCAGLDLPRPARAARIERLLSADQVALVVRKLGGPPREKAAEERERVRNLFLLHLLFGTGARLSEVAQASMNDVHNEGGLWWFEIRHGKGGKARRVPVAQEVAVAYQEYRRLFAAPGEAPLMLSARSRGCHGIGDDAIGAAVKGAFAAAADQLAADGRLEEATHLRAASTHWLRHAHISHLLNTKNVPPALVQKNTGHASLSTLSIYSHDDDLLRHRLIAGEP